MCGQSHGGWNEDVIAVTCEAESVSGKLAVRVYTSLSSAPDDESFAIDNVVVTQITGTVVMVTDMRGSLVVFALNLLGCLVYVRLLLHSRPRLAIFSQSLSRSKLLEAEIYASVLCSRLTCALDNLALINA